MINVPSIKGNRSKQSSWREMVAVFSTSLEPFSNVNLRRALGQLNNNRDHDI